MAGRTGGRKKAPTVVRTAEAPGQTLNVDLCFVPAVHEDAAKLPAVSGSSGHWVVETTHDDGVRSWPGQVFARVEPEYVSAMLAYVAASPPANGPRPHKAFAPQSSATLPSAQALHQAEGELRYERRGVRRRRQVEDGAWHALRDQHRPRTAHPALYTAAARQAEQTQWRALRQQRRQALAQRQADDEAWRQQRLRLRQAQPEAPPGRSWIAILVVTDNCSRQCRGLPLFVAGPKVTAETLVTALRSLLPPELLFLITDRGAHFTASAFTQLMREEEFIHVLVARHRPQSNGIAERFVRTLKQWLMTKAGRNDPALAAWLADFLVAYNQRPHQGLPIPGLSPDEFANRIWLM